MLVVVEVDEAAFASSAVSCRKGSVGLSWMPVPAGVTLTLHVQKHAE